MPSLTVNGVALTYGRLGVRVVGRSNFRAPSPRRLATAPVLGGIGVVPLLATMGEPRELPFRVLVDTATYSDRVAAEQRLKYLVGAGLLTLVASDGVLTRRTYGYAPQLEFEPGVADFSSGSIAATLTFLCPVPLWEAPEPTLLHLDTAGERFPLALGRAPCSWILDLIGGTDPVVTYRTAGGAVVWELDFTGTTITASEDYLRVNARDRAVSYSDDGTVADAVELLVAGQGDFPRPLNPYDGDIETAQYPTLEVSSGTARLAFYETEP